MALHPLFPYRLYLVISEADCLGRPMLSVAEDAILGGVDMIQLREKNNTTKVFLQKALLLKELTDKYGIPLIINDNVEVAQQASAAGIHVGNSDATPLSIRAQVFFRTKLIGYSIEQLSQLANKHAAASDYLGISPVFSTPTKKDTITEWGLNGIEKIRSLTAKPLVAIGNINLANATSIIAAGADCLAVVSAICAAKNPEKASYELKNKLLK